MLTNLIEGRGKEFSSLLKIGDYLGRSLRENVELFYVENGRVTYLTESGKVINAAYQLKPALKLTGIQIDDSSILENQSAFDKVADKKINEMLSNLLESDYETAENSFDGILNLYETKLSYDRIKSRLQEKTERFGEQTKITSSPQFQKVSEIKDKIVQFLKENKSVAKISEIKNGMKLASVVSKAFNLPKLTVESLAKSKTFVVRTNENNSIYEHLCRQELIAKELLEAKQNFDTTWANNEDIAELASMIFERSNDKIAESVAKVISAIPYFALATKKQINTLIGNCISLTEASISNKELTDFVGKIYEMKKPVKSYLLDILNDKYGININNLTDIPTFSNLIKTESVILASLSKLAPKNSIIKQVLSEFADSLKLKNGSESIDLMDFLNEVFTQAGCKEVINETSLMTYMDFNKVADDLGKIGTILKLIQPMVQGGGAAGAGGMPGQNPMATPAAGQMGMGAPSPLPGPQDTPPVEDMAADQEGDALGIPGQDPEEAAIGAQDDMAPEPDGDEGMPGQDPLAAGAPMEEPEPTQHAAGDDLTNLLSSIEDLIGSIKAEIGDVDGMGMEGPVDAPIEGEEGGIPGEEGVPGEEGMEGGKPEFGGGGDEEAPPEEGEGEEPEEEPEGEKAPPKKGKFPPKK